MGALLRFDEAEPESSWLRRSGLIASHREAAEAVRRLGMPPPDAPPTIEELHERLVSTLARASNRPHSAWRCRLRVVATASSFDGHSPWELIAADREASVLLARAADLVSPFFPLVRP